MSRMTIRRMSRTLGPVAALAGVWLLFAVLVPWLKPESSFTAMDNQRLMLQQTAVVGTAAMGAVLIIAAGGVDLSVGSTVGLATMVIAWLLTRGWSPLAAGLVGGVGVATAVGTLIGVLVTGRVWPPPIRRIQLPPFIVTLAMLSILRGVALGLNDQKPIYADAQAGWLLGLMSPGRGAWGWLPPAVWIFLATAAGMSLLLRRTVLGRRALAIGDNVTAARYAGVPVDRSKVLIYAIGVGCAGIAAVMRFSELTMGDPVTGSGLELQVIASCVIGGASLSGGSASVLGAIVGALLMTVVGNGCTKLDLHQWVQMVITGLIILGAVAIDQWRRR